MIYALIAIVIGFIEEKIFKDNFITPIVLISISTIFYNVVFFLFMYLIKSPIHYSGLAMRISIEVVENVVIGMFIYRWAFKKVVGYSLR
jgi:rod shape-determining protein MreD